MNGLKRFEQDATLQMPALDEASDNHPIRSHRQPRDCSVVRGLGVMAMATVAVASIAVGVTTWTTVDQTTPHVISAPSAPLSVPDDPPVDDGLRTAERAVRKETRQETKPVPVKTTATERMVSYSLAQLGKPYRFGAQGGSAFDCSGLVVAAYRAATGTTLYHYTGRLVREGRAVGRTELVRGDIVFPASGHVGIYLGDGQMVHASSSKGRVVIGKVYGFYAARRLL